MTSPLPPPLAELLRPTTLNEVIGQSHLLGPGKPLRLAFESGKLHSMILWGPPGVGKTTIAKLTANTFDCEWIALSAVFSGVKDIRAAVEEAKNYQAKNRHTILFIDEIHRFNKAQQDALLPYTESGLITFIGATTENPSFEVISALLSRAQVYVLKPLTDKELRELLKRAHTKVLSHLNFEEEAIKMLISYADGDARRFLNLLEQVNTAALTLEKTEINAEFINNVLVQSGRRFDKGGENFYDQISALHKSVRGSSPDAALYWLCRMLDGGVDPKYLARRIIRMAWEDIGLADPRALQIANDAATTYERLGTPEGELALAQAVIYLATAAKSNAGYTAFNEAMAFVKKDKSREVPIYLRNAPTHLMKKLGYGAAYRYAHDEPYGYAADVNYFPEGMSSQTWYKPVDRGLELKIAERLAFLKQLDEQARKRE
ncbi:ATPase associated with chromosome architecture (plasmid) [Legionella adelaidensis]|uniref:Replication-associated recombination protein A n=1 Tax=Legionella adelaidensis TaxID=45056 RepID=A0A0W0R349_9GAMM|nr:replication-associated recombination protein A [Legionella adelaidensis]KTC65505.1 recombination factor protein RarA [Legionella adelaidensis]VEH84674.1 ATPase associated with chromosome architecture [Legionella adelaidensis]